MTVVQSILAFGFLAPWMFFAGAAATSIPIIIHLLNKRKFRVVVWAAMDFLLAAQRRNARRLKFQRWLLLAVRCLALIALAMAVGQMVLDTTAMGFLGGGQRGVIVILDDSYSMGWARPGTVSAFETSKKMVGEWLRKLPASDKVMVIRGSRGGVVAGNRPSADHAGLGSQVKGMELTDAGTDLPAALDQAAEALKEMEQTIRTREVIVLTDCSRSAVVSGQWSVASEERLKKAVEAVKARATSFRVFDMGAPDQANVAITQVKLERPVVVAGVAAKVNVTVMNAKDQAEVDLPVTISLDGVPLQTEKIAKVEAGTAKTVVMAITASTPGRHLLEARLASQLDFLATDDVRRLMVDVKREVPVLLVDGNPGDNKTLGSTQFLQTAYLSGTVFSPKVITELELPTTAFATYSAVILSDTGAPRSEVVRENLRKYVEEGGLLMIFPGMHTEAEQMNALLGDAGAKLLPATIGQPMEAPNGVRFAAEGFAHPVLSIFSEHRDADYGFESVQTTHYLKLGVPTDGSTETVLRYMKEDGTPGDAAIVMKAAGRGKVVLFASSADHLWNSWGGKPSFLPILDRLTYYGMSAQSEGLTLGVGDRISLPAEVENPGSWGGPRDVRVSVNSELGKDGRQRLTSGPLPAAGVYGPEGHGVVAVNADASEVDIRHVGAVPMAASLGVDAKELTAGAREIDPKAAGVDPKKSGAPDLARKMLLVALGMFLLETVLARMFSVYR